MLPNKKKETTSKKRLILYVSILSLLLLFYMGILVKQKFGTIHPTFKKEKIEKAENNVGVTLNKNDPSFVSIEQIMSDYLPIVLWIPLIVIIISIGIGLIKLPKK